MLIIKKIILAALLAVSLPVLAQPAAELQTILQPITTLKANFQQTVTNEKNTVIQTSAGQMEFKRPNLFRWQIDVPDKNLVVTDGRKLWNYDVELEQVTVQKVNASKEISPISFLFDDAAKLNRDFTIAKTANQCFKLIPKHANANFVNIEVCFKQQNIHSLRLLDQLGQTSVFKFTQVQNNLPLATARFTFKPPAGVDVIGD